MAVESALSRHPKRRRKRPPRFHLAIAVGLVLSSLSTAATAQNTTTSSTSATLSDPDTRQLQLTSATGVTFFLPATAATDGLVYITLSLCTPPTSLSTTLPTTLPSSLYVSNSTTETLPGPDTATASDIKNDLVAGLENGFGNVTLRATNGAWIGVWAPDDTTLGGTGGGIWTFELSVSTSAPAIVLDKRAGFRFEDSDNGNALLTTANYSKAARPTYEAVVVTTTALSTPLSDSLCHIRGQKGLTEAQFKNSTTARGYNSGVAVQYALSDLAAGTNYTSWLLAASGASTRIWNPVFFTTKTGNTCRLVYDIPFCPSIAYSVPSPPGLNTTSLLSYYNTTIVPYIAAFARTLTTFPCQDLSMGGYSFISTCTSCEASYLSWICSVAMPRCTDPPSNATLSISNSSEWYLPPTTQQILIRDNPKASRTPYFAPDLLSANFPDLIINSTDTTSLETPFPYAEVPPCIDLCNLVQARCPPLVSWACPVEGGTGTAGYGLTEHVNKGDRLAGDVPGGLGKRAGDRFGNVFCNGLGADLITAAQISAARRTIPVASIIARTLGIAVFFYPIVLFGS